MTAEAKIAASTIARISTIVPGFLYEGQVLTLGLREDAGRVAFGENPGHCGRGFYATGRPTSRRRIVVGFVERGTVRSHSGTLPRRTFCAPVPDMKS